MDATGRRDLLLKLADLIERDADYLKELEAMDNVSFLKKLFLLFLLSLFCIILYIFCKYNFCWINV